MAFALDMFVPVHPLAQGVTLFIIGYFLYVTGKGLSTLQHFRRLKASCKKQPKETQRDAKDSSSDAEDLLTDAERNLEAVAGLQHADWRAALEPLHRREMAKVSGLRGATNNLLLAGLLGTVFGLAGTVGTLNDSLGSALQAQTLPEVVSSLQDTIGHMRNAFSCTLWGIFTAVLASLGLRRLHHEAVEALNAADQTVLREIVPKVLPRSEALLLEELRKVLDASRKFLCDFRPAVEEASQKFKNVLDTASRNVEEVTKTLKDTSTQLIGQMETLVGDLRVTAQQVAKNTQELSSASHTAAQSLKGSTEKLAKYHEDLRNAHRELIEVFNQSIDKMRQYFDDQVKLVERLQSLVGTSAQDTVTRLQIVNETLMKATEAFRETGDSFGREGNKLYGKLDDSMQRQTEEIERLFKDHRYALEEVLKELSGIREAVSLQDLADAVNKLQRVAQNLEGIRDLLAEMRADVDRIAKSPIMQTDAYSKNGWNDVPSTLKTMSKGIEALLHHLENPAHERVEQSREVQAEVVILSPKGPGQPLEGKVIETSPLTKKQPEAHPIDVAQLVSKLDKLVDSIERLVDRQSYLPEQLQRTMEELHQAVNDLRRAVESLPEALAKRSLWGRIFGWFGRSRR